MLQMQILEKLSFFLLLPLLLLVLVDALGFFSNKIFESPSNSKKPGTGAKGLQ
jgi:hypothetical protein